MNNILFFMHVPWGWIRQRPHFIAEGLSKFNNVFVVYEMPFRTKYLVKNKTSINVSEIFRLPIKRYSFLYFINVYLVSRYLKKKCQENNIDIIWITDVRLYSYINNIDFGKVKIIYDCMDETLEFPYVLINKRIKNQIKIDETGLVDMCEHVFFSSETLMNRVVERTSVSSEKISVIHNALNNKDDKELSAFADDEVEAVFSKNEGNEYTLITYAGTISDWLDVGCLLRSLRENAKIIYLLVGPVEATLPDHERLIKIGPVEHRHINYILQKSDILVMPFKLNKLIESVDPVKLYEYIAVDKPVVALEYDETKRFSRYVHLYKSCDEYIELINGIVEGKHVKNELSINEFIEKNTWDKRVEQMQKYINLL